MAVEVPGEAPIHRDRIAQLYLGLIDDPYSGPIARARIDWICDQVAGPRVLDIGCSEGILPVLLARRNLQVTGVDINGEALDFARGLLSKETEKVRKRVHLIEGDASQVRLKGSFDTVILGEVIEHLADPGLMLDRALSLLNANGKVLITTPWGHLPDPDH
ncbi:MAG: methyltransferase domain-containing protein, partial [Myxococcota bacterium]|nr:methyltransferase domain-containing protein [Myxococcota bacterium]